MKAITTRFFGPGNVRGSRYKASDEDGNSVTVSTDFALNSDGNQDRAALALCEKMGWTGNLYRGGLKRGNVYVFGPGRSETAQVVES
jgi:hypothetical protein